jgi:hypothetical protein
LKIRVSPTGWGGQNECVIAGSEATKQSFPFIPLFSKEGLGEIFRVGSILQIEPECLGHWIARSVPGNDKKGRHCETV